MLLHANQPIRLHYSHLIKLYNIRLITSKLVNIIKCLFFTNKRYKGSNTSKRARRKNLRHPRERYLVSNVAPSCPLTGVWFFFSLIYHWKYSIVLHETTRTWHMMWHIFWRHWRLTSKVRKRTSINTKKWK